MEKNQETTMEGPIDEVKQQAVLDEYAEHGPSAESVDFAKKEAKLRRKLDLYIAPVMMLLMLISYLDRGNIGLCDPFSLSREVGTAVDISAALRPKEWLKTLVCMATSST